MAYGENNDNYNAPTGIKYELRPSYMTGTKILDSGASYSMLNSLMTEYTLELQHVLYYGI